MVAVLPRTNSSTRSSSAAAKVRMHKFNINTGNCSVVSGQGFYYIYSKILLVQWVHAQMAVDGEVLRKKFCNFALPSDITNISTDRSSNVKCT